MNLKFAFLLFCLVAFSSTPETHKQTSSSETPEEMMEIFFKKYKNEGATAALNDIYKKNEWVNPASEDVQNLIRQMSGLTEDYVGKFYGYEMILEKKLSDSFILKSVLVKYGRQPLRFTFQFYKPNDKWVFYGFSYDANLTDEIKEAAKLYNFRLN